MGISIFSLASFTESPAMWKSICLLLLVCVVIGTEGFKEIGNRAAEEPEAGGSDLNSLLYKAGLQFAESKPKLDVIKPVLTQLINIVKSAGGMAGKEPAAGDLNSLLYKAGLEFGEHK